MARLLIIEGNTLARQRKAAGRGVRSASEIYRRAVHEHFPDLEIDIVNGADRGETPPDGRPLDSYHGLIVGGSSLHAYDDTFEVKNQVEILREFAKTSKPILGSCWGLQIAAIAGGGTVARSPKGREVIFARKIHLSDCGRAHPFFDGKPTVFDAPCIHYDEVTQLPPGSTVLCGNRHSAVQGAVIPVEKSEVWAVQYHPEFDLEQLAMLMTLYGDDLVEEGFVADRKSCDAYRKKIEALGNNPENQAFAWELGIDQDILDPSIRHAEIVNWVKKCILQAEA